MVNRVLLHLQSFIFYLGTGRYGWYRYRLKVLPLTSTFLRSNGKIAHPLMRARMTLKQHVTITTVLSLLLAIFWKNYLGVFLFWIGGIFIDVDHCLDYIRETGDIRISFRKMEEMFLNLREKVLWSFPFV